VQGAWFIVVTDSRFGERIGLPQDKRQHKRAHFQEPIKAHHVIESKSGNVFEVQGSPLLIRAKNISEGGLCLELGDRVKPQMILKLDFQVGPKQKVDVYAKVVWIDQELGGLQFIILDDPIRRTIRQYVEATA